MYFFTLFILLIWFNAESYLCVKYFLQNSASSSIHMKKKITHTESIFIDYNIISNLDLTSLKTVSLKDKGSIFLEDGKKILINNDLSVKTQSNQIQCASATFTNELNKTGWNQLYVKTYNECPVLVQMFAAGLLEGTLTFQEINDFYTNIKSDHEESKIQIASLSQFYKKINNLIESKIKKENFFKELNQTYLNYWTQIALSKAQLEGVYRGYNFRANQKLNLTDFYFINADGQTSELLGYMDYKRNVNLAKETIQTQLSITKSKNIINVESLLKKTHSSNLKEFWIKSLRNSHCSVFLKPLIDSESKDYTNILVSHSTWDDYNAMIRIYKNYDFELEKNDSNNQLQIKNHKVSFSSYPGCISSTDDFYIIDQKIMVTETTLGILNSDAYSKILPDEDYIPDFIRILNANRLSNSAKEWIEWFTLINTGTYNSQWTILDLSNFEKSINKKSLEKETVFVLEQFPGQIHYEDVTHYIQKNGFWASYNVPFFSETRKESGFSQLEKEESASFSYINNIRGQIFKKKSPEINNIEELKYLMLFNQWKNSNSSFLNDDKIDTSSPAEAIAARYDLLEGYDDNFGEIDAKVCDYEMMKKHQVSIISGPSHQNMPIFKWSQAKRQQTHHGLTDEWNFTWIQVDSEIRKEEN